MPADKSPPDVEGVHPRMLEIDVKATWDALRKREDTDANYQITRDDKGPKVSSLQPAHVTYHVFVS